MSQSWEQALINSQLNVNRAVFEMNRPGCRQDDPWYAAQPSLEYVRSQVVEAIADLRECLSLIPGSQLELPTEDK